MVQSKQWLRGCWHTYIRHRPKNERQWRVFPTIWNMPWIWTIAVYVEWEQRLPCFLLEPKGVATAKFYQRHIATFQTINPNPKLIVYFNQQIMEIAECTGQLLSQLSIYWKMNPLLQTSIHFVSQNR